MCRLPIQRRRVSSGRASRRGGVHCFECGYPESTELRSLRQNRSEEEEEELNFDQTLAYCPQWSRGPSTLHYCTTRDLQLQRRPWNQHLNVDQLGSSIPLP